MKFSEYKPDWPKWAPKSVIDEWEENFAEHVEVCNKSLGEIDQTFIKITYYDEPSLIALLERILTNPKMEKVWDKIISLNIKPSLFSNVLSLAYLGPQGINKKTAKQQEEWVRRVQSLSLELANLLELTELEDYLFNDFKKADTKYILNQAMSFGIDPKCKCDGKANACKTRFPYRPPRLPDMLRKLSIDARKLVNGEYRDNFILPDKKIYLPSPGKEESPHLYFIRYLSLFFLEQTNGKNLFREYVKICAEVAFGKTFSTREIEKIAHKNSLL
jgi:hypothetical protein